jgi:dephospho-CoA kinase
LKSIITLSGRICSGKSHVAKLLSYEFGFPVASFGGYLKYYCQQNNILVERESLQNIGEEFVRTAPQQFLIDVISHFSGSSDKIILEGVRHKSILGGIEELTENAITVFIDADIQTRFKRCLERNKDSDRIKTYEDFINLDNHQVELEIESLKSHCNLIIDSTADYTHELFAFISSNLKK